MADTQSTNKMKRRTKLFYGVGDLGNAAVNSAIQFFLMKFYTDGALILPSLAGNALLIGKIWDAINDPLFGWVTDKTNSRHGKRRVYMIYGAIPLALAIALLWFVPPGISQVMTFTWIALSFCIFDTLWTMTNVPYYALTSELTDDYDERSSLTTYRMVMAVPAYLVGAALTPAIVGLFALQRTGFAVIGILYGVIAAAALLISASGFRERKRVEETKAETSPFKSMGAALRNKPFTWLCGTYFVVNISFAFIKILMVYYIEYQLLMKAQTSLVMGLMLICVTISLPFWQWISRRMDKGPAYALGMAFGALAVVLTYFLPHQATRLDLPHRSPGWLRLFSPMDLSVGHGGRCSRLRPSRNRPTTERHVLWRLGSGHQDFRGAGPGCRGLDSDRFWLCAQRGTDTPRAGGDTPVLRLNSSSIHLRLHPAVDPVSDHPEESRRSPPEAGRKRRAGGSC